MKPLLTLLLGLLLQFSFLDNTYAQNDLAITYDISGIPNRLNICGEPDTVVVIVRTNGINTDTRDNITAALKLAGGIRMHTFLAAESTAGVLLNSGTGTNNATFSIPDLSPNGLNEATVSFLVQADCSINDSLAQDPTYDLMDNWTLSYSLDGAPAANVSATLNSYRAAIRIPDFVLNTTSINQKIKTGDCVTRTVTLNNTSLDAHTNSMVYAVRMSPALSYKAIRINGIDAIFTKTIDVSGDTILVVNLVAAHFTANTGSTNNDNLFDSGEILTIEEDFCIVNCVDGYVTNHTASYGCYATTCTAYSQDENLEQGQGTITIAFDTINQVTVGYCKTGVSAVKIKNTGVAVDPGFANIFNIKPGIGMGNPASLSAGGFSITNVTVQGIVLNDTEVLKVIDNNPLFAVDPDGVGGLSDLDGDGFFDDLAAGDSIVIEIEYDFNCGDAANFDLSSNCDTAFLTHLSAYLTYDDPCRVQQQDEKANYLTITNKVITVENYSTPDVDAGSGDIFYLRHVQNRIFFNFDQGCTDGNYYVQMVLPQGITLVPGNTTLQRPFLNHPLVSSSMSNDTLTVLFAPSPIESLLGEYELSLAFSADCTAQDGEVNFIGEFGYTCADCNCKHIWFCTNMSGTYVHVKNPPCPTAPICDNTIQTNAMDMSRTTFGFTDATYTTQINPLSTNTKSALNCDTMLMTIEGVSGTAYTGNNVGIDVSYANPLYELGTDEVFLFGRGYIEIIRGATTMTCEIPANSLTTTTADPYKNLDFNLEASLQGCSITIQPNDEVNAYLYFTVNSDGPFPNQFYLVPELRSGFYVNPAAKITCGTYGDQVKVGKNSSLATTPSQSTLPQGCDTAYLAYKIIPIFNSYADEFPNEHRPAVGIDSIIFNYDALHLLNGFEDLTVQAAFFDHPFHGNSFYDIGTLDNSGHFVATFDTLSLLPSLVNINKAAFTVRIVAVPKCESIRGGGGGSNLPLNHYEFETKIHYKTNYHAFNISGGACLKDSLFTSSNNITYSNPPETIMDNLGSPVAMANGDIFKWTIRQCNSTNYADANVAWLSIENISSSINILKMEDITDPGNIIDLTVLDDGNGGFYANTNGLLRASGGNTPNDICNIIDITGQLNDCGTVDATIKSGWNCTAFNQTLHNFCPEEELAVQARSSSPLLSIIQTSGAIPTAFCDTIPVELEIKNTQLGRYIDMNIDLVLPPDLEIVPGSFRIAWPKSAPFVVLGSEPTYVSSSIYGDTYSFHPYAPFPDLLANGLNQVNPSMPNDSNELVIQYELISDCGYSSGRSSQINIYGQEFCGTATDTTGFTTFPFFITGSEPDPANAFQIDVTMPDTISGLVPVSIQITNLGDSISGPNDKIRMLLSQGIDYVPNSANSIGWTVGEPVITIANGITTLEWNLPQGLSKTIVDSFSLVLNSDGIGCASIDFPIGFMSIREKQEFCVATSNTCTVDIITSPLQVKDIHKRGSPTVSISASVSATLCAGETINLIAEGFDDITWSLLPSNDIIGIGNPLPFQPSLGQTSIIATATDDPCPVSADTLNITVLDAPSLVLPEDLNIFEGDTILIAGVLTTNIPTTLTWTPLSDLSDPLIVNPLAFPSNTTQYILEAMGSTGCASIDTIVITVSPKIDTVPCPILNISEDNANYLVVCGLEANFPLNIDFDSLDNYHILSNGVLVNDFVSPSDDSIGIYNISGMSTAAGPFDIIWVFNNSIHEVTLPSLNDLLNQLSIWDNFGNWYYDQDNENIWGGAIFNQYGELNITNNNGYSVIVPFGKTDTYGQSELALPLGNYELILFNTVLVCADTVLLNVSCEDYNPNTPTGCVTETIFINQEMQFCFGDILPGEIVSAIDICANPAADAVDYSFIDSTSCLDYIGAAIGIDSACIVVCDEFGLCDTVNFCTEVVTYDGDPYVNDDSLCTYMNTPQVFDLLANDTVWGGIDTMYLVNESLNGEITLNLDYSITYTPNRDVCERTERIQYIVCNSNACADAFAEICIVCDDIVVFTAISPNGDGANDVFYIANIENYPNSIIEVYNRWGNRVYRSIGYKNDWDGNWAQKKIIPDGTYFYVIKLNDRENRVFKGHLEIRR